MTLSALCAEWRPNWRFNALLMGAGAVYVRDATRGRRWPTVRGRAWAPTRLRAREQLEGGRQ
jgi:hypothetical protein